MEKLYNVLVAHGVLMDFLRLAAAENSHDDAIFERVSEAFVWPAETFHIWFAIDNEVGNFECTFGEFREYAIEQSRPIEERALLAMEALRCM